MRSLLHPHMVVSISTYMLIASIRKWLGGAWERDIWDVSSYTKSIYEIFLLRGVNIVPRKELDFFFKVTEV